MTPDEQKGMAAAQWREMNEMIQRLSIMAADWTNVSHYNQSMLLGLMDDMELAMAELVLGDGYDVEEDKMGRDPWP